MALIEFLVVILMALPISVKDRGIETSDQRQTRMEMIARAINEASSLATCSNQYATDCKRIWFRSQKELAVLLVTTAHFESSFALNVHENNCLPHECDSYRDVKTGKVLHRARSLWQIHAGGLVSQQEWDSMAGTSYESTRAAAWGATKILSSGLGMCKTLDGAMSTYAGRGCSWSGSKERISWFNDTMNKPIKNNR